MLDWDSDELQWATQVHEKFKLELNCEDLNYLQNKWDIMNLSEHLQASTAAGIIDKFRGASNYLKDKTSLSQIELVLVLRAKCKEEVLDIRYLSTKNNSRHINETKATHVVVGVTYGAEAYCVLTQDLGTKLNEEDARVEAREEAKKNLSNWGSKLLNALKEKQSVGDFQKGFSEKERKSLTRIKCRLYADLQTLAVRECTVIDAYKHCMKLIEEVQLTGDETKAVPISIVLFPLKRMIGSAKETGMQLQYRDENSDLVSRCCRIFTKLEIVSDEAEIVSDEAEIVQKYDNKSIRTALRPFIKAIDKFQVLLKKELKTAVLKARKSKDDEDGDEELKKLANTAEKHPLFKPSRLKLWLKYKKSEFDLLEKMSKTKGITLFSSLKSLAGELADSQKKYTLVLCVASVDKGAKEILAKMKECVTSNQNIVEGTSEENEEEGKDLPWHMDRRKRKDVLEKVREFSDYAENNKHSEDKVQFFTVIGNVRKGLCRYSLYEFENVLKESIGHLPRPPTGLKIKSKTSSSVHVEWNHEELGYPFDYLIEYRLKNNETWKQQKRKPGENQMVINLKEGLEMEIRVAVDTCIGTSKFSDTINIDTDLNDTEINSRVIDLSSNQLLFLDIGTRNESLIPFDTVCRPFTMEMMETEPMIAQNKTNRVFSENKLGYIQNFKGIDQSDCIEMAALGRRFKLGNLYDYRNDQLTGILIYYINTNYFYQFKLINICFHFEFDR